MKKIILALAKNENQAQKLLDRLFQAQNFSTEEISVLLKSPRAEIEEEFELQEDYPASSTTKAKQYKSPYSKPTRENAEEEYSQSSEKNVREQIANEPLRNALRNLNEFGTISLPGLGLFFAGGPLKKALTLKKENNLTTALINLGLLEAESKRLENRIKEGLTLVAVIVDSNEAIEEARRLFEKEGAQEICYSREKVSKR